jgi:glucosyl-3-phosphoglycerate synthase
VAKSWSEGIHDTVLDEQGSLLIVGLPTVELPVERLFGPPIDALFAEPPCDLIVIKLAAHPFGPHVLLPTNDGPHLSLSYEIAHSITELVDGQVTLMHVMEPQRPGEIIAPERVQELCALPRVGQWVERAGPVLPAIMKASGEADVMVLGATGRSFEPAQPLGALGEAVLREYTGTLVITRRVLEEAEEHAVGRFETRRDTPAQVDRWFAENTFHADECSDLGQLLALKHRSGLSISLVLPALNEAETIGPLLDALIGPLFEDVPLLDEIILIDSGSTDGTCEIVAERGIPIWVHQEILPQYGAFHGKGEALWKSLHVSRGDIVVWIDTDIKDVHPRFVYGLVGPLLREPRLQFTKGFYRRPIQNGDQIVGTGGGRVTELVARPLLNLFFPELSGFIQPLAGEYAGRREILERLPFFTGYSVEIGLLIDLLGTIGLEGMAQVDLQQRIHRNQELDGLSRMSFAIIQTVLERLESRQRLHLLDPLAQSLKQIQYLGDGGYHLDVRAVRDHERPPINTLPEYTARLALAST